MTAIIQATSTDWHGSTSGLIHFAVYFFTFIFLGSQVWHEEVPRLGIESELQLLATKIEILKPPSEARDQTHILMDTNQVRNPLSHKGKFWSYYYCV